MIALLRKAVELGVTRDQTWCSNFSRPRSGRKYIVAGNAIITECGFRHCSSRSVLSWAESDEDPSIVFGVHRSQAARRGGLNLKRVPAMPTAIKLVVCGSQGITAKCSKATRQFRGERAFAARHASVAFVGPACLSLTAAGNCTDS